MTRSPQRSGGRMRSTLVLLAVTLGLGALSPGTSANVVASSEGEKVAMIDNCDPNADWGPGGCLIEEGSVSRAEFTALLVSPLSPTVVGHPSWRMDPGYLTVEPGEKVKVKN